MDGAGGTEGEETRGRVGRKEDTEPGGGLSGPCGWGGTEPAAGIDMTPSVAMWWAGRGGWRGRRGGTEPAVGIDDGGPGGPQRVSAPLLARGTLRRERARARRHATDIIYIV